MSVSPVIRSRFSGSLLLAILLVMTLLAATPAGAHPEELSEASSDEGSAASAAGTFDGVRLLAHADPGTGFNADVWAHKQHAYLGSAGPVEGHCPSQGVRVYDLHRPSDPVHIATFADVDGEPEVAGTWAEKVIVQRVATRHFRGDLAAVSFQRCTPGPDGFRGFGVYDVTDPANPQQLALVASDPRTRGSHELWLEVRGNRTYVYTAIIDAEWTTRPDDDTPGPDKDFQIWDVSDPTAPVRVGQWGAWEELDGRPHFTDEHGVVRRNIVHSVIGSVVGPRDRAYLSYWDLGTVILDVSDPANPEFLGRTEFEPHEEGNAHSAWLARGGNILIQTDEDFDPAPTDVIEQAWGYGRIFDISDPANPDQLATIELPSTRQFPPPAEGRFTIHDPKVRGSTAYFSWYTEGVVMFDISDPADPTKSAQFVPPAMDDPAGVRPTFTNVWGVALDRNYVLASDINSGLWIFTLDRSSR
jgi:hypothetical protein